MKIRNDFSSTLVHLANDTKHCETDEIMKWYAQLAHVRTYCRLVCADIFRFFSSYVRRKKYALLVLPDVVVARPYAYEAVIVNMCVRCQMMMDRWGVWRLVLNTSNDDGVIFFTSFLWKWNGIHSMNSPKNMQRFLIDEFSIDGPIMVQHNDCVRKRFKCKPTYFLRSWLMRFWVVLTTAVSCTTTLPIWIQRQQSAAPSIFRSNSSVCLNVWRSMQSLGIIFRLSSFDWF